MLNARDMQEIHGVSVNHLYVLLNNNNQFVHKVGGKIYVDDKQLLRRRRFLKKIWLMCHEYYYSITEHQNEYRLAKKLEEATGTKQQTWAVFMCTTLFSLSIVEDGSIFKYKVPVNMWKFFRVTRFMIRKITRLENKRADGIYKRLPNRDRYDEIYKERGCKR